jgi:hypothetical protein
MLGNEATGILTAPSSQGTVSKDGKSMKVESADKQRGTTMTYTAEKQP